MTIRGLRAIGRVTLCTLALSQAQAIAQDATGAPDEGPVRGRSGLNQVPSSASADPGPAPRPAPGSEPSAPSIQTPSSAPAAEPASLAERSTPTPVEARSARAPLNGPRADATLYPRLLPSEDRHGEAFADRVSISPDGRRLAVGTQDGPRYAVQIVGVSRKATERTLRGRGTLAWVGWADDGTALIGAQERGTGAVTAYDVASGRARVLGARSDGGVPGVLAVLPDGRVVLADASRPALPCANGTRPPAEADGVPLRVAGPPDAAGRLVMRGEAGGRGLVAPFDCRTGDLAAPLHDGEAPTGLLVNPALRRYEGVWTEAGPRYFDRSLAYEMAEVAASFPEPVDVYPIETTRSPNTLLLYVVGERVPGGYYVLDRYAGDLDLHVTYRLGEAETAPN